MPALGCRHAGQALYQRSARTLRRTLGRYPDTGCGGSLFEPVAAPLECSRSAGRPYWRRSPRRGASGLRARPGPTLQRATSESVVGLRRPAATSLLLVPAQGRWECRRSFRSSQPRGPDEDSSRRMCESHRRAGGELSGRTAPARACCDTSSPGPRRRCQIAAPSLSNRTRSPMSGERSASTLGRAARAEAPSAESDRRQGPR